VLDVSIFPLSMIVIFELFGFISGHSIKHMVAALGLLIFLLIEKKDSKH
jgi:hypothetical protein